MRSQTVKDSHKARATVGAVPERSVPAGNIYIYRNQNSGSEQNEGDMKRTAAVMPSKTDAKQHEYEESSRCCETENEEEGRNANADRDLNETQSLNFLNLGIHGARE